MRLRLAVILAVVATTPAWIGHPPAVAARPRLRAEADSAPDSNIAVRTFQFAPDTFRARGGTRVVWTNSDDIEHTITSGVPDARDGHFHGVLAKRGTTFSAVLEQPGAYRYFCDRHRFMSGTVIITP